jgi:hypothetical protein
MQKATYLGETLSQFSKKKTQLIKGEDKRHPDTSLYTPLVVRVSVNHNNLFHVNIYNIKQSHTIISIYNKWS